MQIKLALKVAQDAIHLKHLPLMNDKSTSTHQATPNCLCSCGQAYRVITTLLKDLAVDRKMQRAERLVRMRQINDAIMKTERPRLIKGARAAVGPESVSSKWRGEKNAREEAAREFSNPGSRYNDDFDFEAHIARIDAEMAEEEIVVSSAASIATFNPNVSYIQDYVRLEPINNFEE